MRAVPSPSTTEPTLDDVARTWDLNANSRSAELHSNSDPAYRAMKHHVAATLRRQLGEGPFAILDAGCGVGALSGYLSSLSNDVTGVDCSPRSIDVARTRHPNCSFSSISLELYAQRNAGAAFDALIANMVLHCTPDLAGFLSAAHSLLRPGGLLIALLPHPAFYLSGRPGVPSISPTEQAHFTLPFRIRGRTPHPASVWYFHRPISAYINSLDDAGFSSVRAEEPYQIGPGRSHDIFSLTAGASADSRRP